MKMFPHVQVLLISNHVLEHVSKTICVAIYCHISYRVCSIFTLSAELKYINTDAYFGIKYSMSYRLNSQEIGVRFPEGKVIFVLSAVSRPVLEPAEPLIQWAPCGGGGKWQGCEADHSSFNYC
jgi:hypothetical protein